MNISKELEQQVERYNKTRSFALDAPLKKELADWYKDAGFGTLNIGCATCIRNAMQKLSNYYLTEKAPMSPKIHFIGIKQEPMTFNQLKAEAKRRGIKMPNTSTKEDLIKALS
jgi:phage FluMu protein Com